ncbi:Protein of unknown function (DUF3245) [Teratosphaeria destructans]|uniref:Uncharacterized protein n=1 Tax=Teratosphaeria destructans TaxID=418781 RepID=A0A9W7SL75_9PEZI|nr:Protein of unknown function (DUF3245) [Teratosphaeria destructans]
MTDNQTEADIIFNRANVALARSQRLIASWLPPKTEESTTTHPREEDDSDWGGEDELAGVGSKRKPEDQGLPDGAFKRRNLASNDKLLEQIMGKKAAQAKRKQDAKKVSVHAAPKPMNGSVKQSVKVREESEEEEEEGRAAVFKSRRQKRVPQRQPQDEDLAEVGKEEEAADYIALDTAPATAADSEPEQRPQKKVKASYLDEILGQKAKKSKKKKKQKNNANAAAT